MIVGREQLIVVGDTGAVGFIVSSNQSLGLDGSQVRTTERSSRSRLSPGTADSPDAIASASVVAPRASTRKAAVRRLHSASSPVVGAGLLPRRKPAITRFVLHYLVIEIWFMFRRVCRLKFNLMPYGIWPSNISNISNILFPRVIF